MKIVKKDTPIYNRRIILIDEEKNTGNVNWKQIGEDLFSFGSYLKVAYKSFNFSENYLNDVTGFGEISYCNNNFRFPPQHPQKGIVYSCPDFEPDFYIPISNFHQHSLKLKESAFIEMCAHLGAKEITLIEAMEDGEKVNVNIDGENIPTQNGNVSGGAKGGYNKSTISSSEIRYSFPKPKEITSIPYSNKWIECEPTWRTLQKVRLENKAVEYFADLNYTDEMGITAELSGKLNKLGLKIGGNFNKIKKVERKYKVVYLVII